MSIAFRRSHAFARLFLPTLLVLVTAAQCTVSRRIGGSEFRSGEYNGRIAHALAELSHISYDIDYDQDREVPADLLKRVKGYIQIDRSATFQDGAKDTAGFIVANDDVVVVVFRGTKTVSNMLTDINALKTGFSHGEVSGQVHAGFLSAGTPVFDDIRRKLSRLQDSNQPILFTGHSLGGALATLAVARRLVPPGQVFGLYTYGSPRVGDNGFAATFDGRYKQRTFRFSNYRDPVTRVPPELIGYRHVGRLLYFDDDGDLRHAPANPHTCGIFSAGTCAKDHGIDNYVESIGDNLDKNPFMPGEKGCILWPF